MGKTIYFIINAAILYGFIFLASYIDYKIKYEKILSHNLSGHIVYFHIIDIIIGLMLGSSIFISEIKKAGRLKINIEKLLIMGAIPFYIVISYHVGRFFVPQLFQLMPYLVQMISSVYFVHVMAITLGYVLVTSFYKD